MFLSQPFSLHIFSPFSPRTFSLRKLDNTTLCLSTSYTLPDRQWVMNLVNELDNNTKDRSTKIIKNVTRWLRATYTRFNQCTPPSPTLRVLRPVRPDFGSRLTLPWLFIYYRDSWRTPQQKKEAPRIPRYLFFKRELLLNDCPAGANILRVQLSLKLSNQVSPGPDVVWIVLIVIGFQDRLLRSPLIKSVSVHDLLDVGVDPFPFSNRELHDGVSCDVEQYCVMWLLNHYREDCREDWRTSQRFRTPCAGLDYNLLRLKGLAGIIFGQPPRASIIHCRPGQHNNKKRA